MVGWAEQDQMNKSIIPQAETLCYKFDGSQLLTACWLTCAHMAPLCSAFAGYLPCRLFSPWNTAISQPRGQEQAYVHAEVQHILGYRTHPWETKRYSFSCICFSLLFILKGLLYFESTAKCFPIVVRNSKCFFLCSLGCTCHVLLQVRGKKTENRNMFLVPGPQDEQVEDHPIQTQKYF